MTKEIDVSSALKLGIKILNQWGCSNSQKAAILGFPDKAINCAHAENESLNLTKEQLERLSYVLNIHCTLKTKFSNSKNVDGFMSMKNHNEFFNGSTPLSIICGGSNSVSLLREVYRRIEHMCYR